MKRNSRVECVRIFAMILVVLSHFSFFGPMGLPDATGLNYHILRYTTLGNLGNFLFFLICGYFGVELEFRISRVIKLWARVWTYSVILFLLSVVILHTEVQMKDIMTVLFPFSFNEYWFFSAYIIITLFSPFVNRAIINLNSLERYKLIILMIVLWFIIGFVPITSVWQSQLPVSFTCYVIGASLKKKPVNNIRLFAVAAAIGATCVIVMPFILDRIFKSRIDAFLGINSLPLLVIAVYIFILSVQGKTYYNKWINNIATSLFGVYLIHENPNLRFFIWRDIFEVDKYYNTPYLPICMVYSVAVLFVACVLIDIVKQYLIDRPINKVIDRHFS